MSIKSTLADDRAATCARTSASDMPMVWKSDELSLTPMQKPFEVAARISAITRRVNFNRFSGVPP